MLKTRHTVNMDNFLTNYFKNPCRVFISLIVPTSPVNLSDLYIDMLDPYVNLSHVHFSDFYVDLSEGHLHRS